MERYFIDLLQLLGQTADLNELNLLCLVGYKNNFWKVLKKKKPKTNHNYFPPFRKFNFWELIYQQLHLF